MLPFPFGEDLPSQAQKTHCEQSRIVHVAAFALSNSGESERYHALSMLSYVILCDLQYSSLFIYLIYLGVAPPFSRWQLEIRSSKVFPRSSKVLCVGPQAPDAVDRLRSCHFASEQRASHAMLTQFQQLLLGQRT